MNFNSPLFHFLFLFFLTLFTLSFLLENYFTKLLFFPFYLFYLH